MTNLLPENYKRAIKREYQVRRAIVTLVLLSVLGVVSAISFLPSFMTVLERRASAQNELDQLKAESEEKDIQRHLDQLKRINQLTEVLEPPRSELRNYVILNNLLEKSVAGVSLTGLTIQKQDLDRTSEEAKDPAAAEEGQEPAAEDKPARSRKVRISLSGMAEDRETLTSFSQALEGVRFVDSVHLPVSELASKQDIEFSMELSGEF